MVKPEQIPDEVVEAAREAWLRSDVNARDDWRAAIAAAINAWPGVKENKVQVPDDSDEIRYTLKTTGIILPLPEAPQGRIAKQEEARDEAVP